MRILFFIFILNLATSVLDAQAIQGQSNLQVLWFPDFRVQLETDRIIKVDRASGAATALKTPPNTIWATYQEGRYWALEAASVPPKIAGNEGTTIANGQEDHSQRIWTSTDFEKWEESGRLTGTNATGATAMVPLSNGSFFFIKRLGLHFIPNSYSPLYIARQTPNGILKDTENVELDFGPMYAHKPGMPDDWADFQNLIYNRNFQVIKNVAFELPETLFQHEDGFVLYSKQLGIFWFFDKNGHLNSRQQLYKLMRNDDFSKIFSFERAIVYSQATPSQTLLIASRTKESVWFNQHFFPTGPVTPEGEIITPGLRALNQRRGDDLNPNLEWYELDPRKGKLIPISPPFEAPTTIREVPAHCEIWFEFDWDGSIRYLGKPDSACQAPADPPARPPLEGGSGGMRNHIGDSTSRGARLQSFTYATAG